MAREDEYNELFDRLRDTAVKQLTQARIDPSGDKSLKIKDYILESLDSWYELGLSKTDQEGFAVQYELLRADIVGF